MFGQPAPAYPAREPCPVAWLLPKRARLSAPPSGDPAPPLPPQPSGTCHQLHTWGKAEWCSRCGRVSAAAAQGRAQQWRRPCHPLPSYVSKRDKGHKLIYTGQWHCVACPCPPDKLYRQLCGRPGEVRPTPLSMLGVHPPCEAPGHVAPGKPPLSTTQAPGRAHGGVRPQASAQGSHMGRPPLQAAITRFFGPSSKRPRLSECGPASLPQATARPPG